MVGSGLMRRGTLQVSLLVLSLAGGLVRAAEPGSPEDVLRRYLQALKAEKFDEVYDLISSTMRQGRSKELYVKEFQAMMGVADFKIFDFTVYPAKVEGEKALVPNILESQDRFINTLGLTEHELYTLVREGGAWRVDAQTLVDPPDRAKWFPKQGEGARRPGGQASAVPDRADRPLTVREPLCYVARGSLRKATPGGNLMHLKPILCGVVLVALGIGCHREVEMLPLVERTIYQTDRFYDVQAVSKQRAIVVGYGGKIVETATRAGTGTVLSSGTDSALYGVKLVDDTTGWIVGQDGLVLDTKDGGRAGPAGVECDVRGHRRDGEARLPLQRRGDGPQHVWAVGDRSVLASSSDGGQTWRSRKIQMEPICRAA